MIKDVEIHRAVLLEVLSAVQAEGYGIKNLIASPLIGPKGNREFFVQLTYPTRDNADMTERIDALLEYEPIEK